MSGPCSTASTVFAISSFSASICTVSPSTSSSSEAVGDLLAAMDASGVTLFLPGDFSAWVIHRKLILYKIILLKKNYSYNNIHLMFSGRKMMQNCV